ncbi:MAG: hypothetical protein H7A01_08670 [Hahellaceae bacterium]|nr:hypothetical protein [Hahellaceae bacterium]MCP5211456.1 hypothetical protein [Hahellaceae bacterium]
MSISSILPIHIGVSGHTDIPASDHKTVKEKLLKKFQNLRKSHKHTKINVLCGLAGGADTLAAQAALKAGLSLIAVLPMPQEEYEQDFKHPADLNEFRRLLGESEKTVSLPMQETRDECYEQLGRYLVKHSQLVIALWDGISEQRDAQGNLAILVGGTADVVRMCTEGVNHDKEFSLSAPDKTYCEQLVTRRIKHEKEVPPVKLAQLYEWKPVIESKNDPEYKIELLFKKTERFNYHAQKLKSSATNAIEKSKGYLLGESPPKQVLSPIEGVINCFAIADTLAAKRQVERARYIGLVSLAALLSITAQQIYAGLVMNWQWFLAHTVFLAIAFALYFWFFKGRDGREVQFVEWRTLAEGLRVQVFWYAAGINERASDHYRTTKLNELDWVVESLNNLMFDIAPTQGDAVHWVKKCWIEDQYKYFIGTKGKAKLNEQKAKKFQRLCHYCIGTAFAFMLLTVWITLSPTILATAIDFILILVAMAFVFFALLKNYASQMGFEEIGLRYKRSGCFFEQADAQIEKTLKVQPPDLEKARLVITTMGKEALNENAAWLQLHNMNQFEFDIA